MAEFFVPEILGQLTKLSDVAFKKIEERVNLVMEVEEEVKNLTSKLTTIKEKLHNAERRRVEETGVDGWLVRLEDITYEMEDVLDDWNIKVDKPRNLDQEAQVKVSRMPTLLKKGYLGPHSETGDDMLNVKGRDYFKNLAMRSFFQEFGRSEWDENVIESCRMHDIVHDFAQFLTKNECRTCDEVDCQRVESNGGYLSKERVRHLTLLGKAKSINSSVVVDIGKVRSLLFINSSTELIPQDLCSSMKSVRSLILSKCKLQELPPEIGSLIHLRCLDVSWNRSLKELPETVCDLHFLESLDVSWCHNLERLPQRIGDLVHLRYLLNEETEEAKEMPPGIEKLTWLWNLGRFVADGTPLNNLGKLEHLNQLEQLTIIVRGHVDFESAQLGKKINLRILEFEFRGEGLDIESIEIIEPPPNLQ